ncbi:hypothetical protein Y032_0096g2924 [Ancylostoma ceylanicum]|uniref:Uncharacterized protein n=1 Tax=Ancylostoma ceylanicum TaxID=53326 RepID=A0A016TKJ2_9BILA|nr:hypothetical protein Y032_0096g2924 [Ancylostoma ceylanicum]
MQRGKFSDDNCYDIQGCWEERIHWSADSIREGVFTVFRKLRRGAVRGTIRCELNSRISTRARVAANVAGCRN